MKSAIEQAREHGLVPLILAQDLARLTGERPELLKSDAHLAAALRALGYSDGEVDARLTMAGRLQ